MANNFASDSSCIALWRFEDGALTTDSKGTDTLNLANSPAGTTVLFKEGGGAITLLSASAQYAYITDSNLSSSFPLKSGVTTTQMTVCCWVRPTTVDTNKRRVWAKYNTTGNQRSVEFYTYSNRCYFQYSTTGANSYEVDLGFTVTQMTANQWYHIALVLDWSALTWRVTFYNDTAGTDYNGSGTLNGAIYLSTADWRIGTDDNPSANLYFNGQVDEMVVFNRALSNYEVYEIRGGLFPASTDCWHVDAVNGDNSYTGTSWAQAWKTIQHYFQPGDVIKVAKSPETPLSGTVTATNGSEVINTTDDLSGSLSQYTFVKIGSDQDLYMVWSSTSSTVTLHRGYKGTTGSGKSITQISPVAKTTTSDWSKTGDGTSFDNMISLHGGYDTSTGLQDGFTISDWGGSYTNVFGSSLTFWDLSRIYLYWASSSHWAYAYSCTFDDCGGFRNENYNFFYIARDLTCTNLNCQYFQTNSLYDSVIDDLETGNPSGIKSINLGTCVNTVYNRWKNAGWAHASGAAVILQSNNIKNVRFFDAIFDALGKGCRHFAVSNYSAFFNDFNFFNPQIGSGELFDDYGLSWTFLGEIGLSCVNGDETDNRTIICLGQTYPLANVYPGILQSDSSVYRTAAPSAKMTLSSWTSPFIIHHVVPCNANEEMTVSAYLRKNSSYGSSNLPRMRLEWVVSLPAGLSFCSYDAVMSDTDDTFVQVSHTLTPGITGAVNVDFVFHSSNSGAIAWYDDIEIS